MSKKGFLFGLVVGGAAIVTVAMKMDDDKKAELKAKAQQGLADFKDRAIDYAFYANDAAEDFKEEAGKQFADAKSKVADFADQYQTAKSEDGEGFSSSLDQATDSLRSELARVEAEGDDDDADDSDDIVIDSSAAFKAETDSADNDSATSADSEAATSATSAADSADDEPADK
ncbi:YtxH domain-containing protein [Lactiplantibacillus sp. WILCCON 0030]|uniref:YtxH domain-containing protein n=1 Tax=Lactiplantibacillus brownii TaxID=3069269 RepID=A0ABU1A9N4_9LACO|nr:YtxH domain-containing protein [Lactiplantibacillus brownii]MDQ7937688.1 YtxH domain-containing protein [Lactiplantibacillus brownii]